MIWIVQHVLWFYFQINKWVLIVVGTALNAFHASLTHNCIAYSSPWDIDKFLIFISCETKIKIVWNKCINFTVFLKQMFMKSVYFWDVEMSIKAIWKMSFLNLNKLISKESDHTQLKPCVFRYLFAVIAWLINIYINTQQGITKVPKVRMKESYRIALHQHIWHLQI